MKSTGRSRDPRLAVLVADDDARVRQGLREMIQFLSDAVVVGEASSARSALQLDLALRPDVVILDLLLPRGRGRPRRPPRAERAGKACRRHQRLGIPGPSSAGVRRCFLP